MSKKHNLSAFVFELSDDEGKSCQNYNVTTETMAKIHRFLSSVE